MNKNLLRFSLVLGGIVTAGNAASVTFNTFVTSGALDAAVGHHDVIGFTYAGDKFVGTVYFFNGSELQLYRTDLNGGNVQPFGSPLPNTLPSTEIVVAGSLGQGGFGAGTVYAGAGTEV